MVAPLVAGAAISGAGSLIGGITGGKSAKKAAKISAASAAADRAQALSIYNTNMGMAQPSVDRGNRAGEQIDALLGLGGNPSAANDALAAWRNGTGYQDALAGGLSAVNTQYAARGALESGAAQKSLAKYGAGLANQTYGQYFDALRGQQVVGQNAMATVTGAGNSFQNASAAANNSASSAAANAALIGGQSMQNALAGLGNAFGGYYGQLDARQNASSFKVPDALAGAGNPYSVGANASVFSGPFALGPQAGASSYWGGPNGTWPGHGPLSQNPFGR